MEITRKSAYELGRMIKERKISAVEALMEQLAAVKAREADYQCYLTIAEEKAIEEAKKVQKGIDLGLYKDSPLAGVPIAVKDNICTKGIRTTCASKMLESFIPPYDATVIRKIKEAGIVTIGKANMDEFAMGSTTETSFFQQTKNPWDLTKVPGGSSGGAAAAVAAEEAFLALGSDTGGSIRQPSSFCGVTGIKPTYGLVSRYGLIAYASSLDQIGPIGRNVTDCATLLEVIAGMDPYDSTCMQAKAPSYQQALQDDVSGMRIGIPNAYLEDGLEEEIKEQILNAAEVFRKKGAKVEFFDLAAVSYAIPAYYVIACAEASSNLSRFDGVKYGYHASEFENLKELYEKTRSEGFGNEVKRRMMIGSFVLSSGYYDAYYNKALKVKALIKKAFDQAFLSYDLILGPTAPTTAPKLGESLTDPLKMYLGDIYTVSVNLAGLPAISLPCGESQDGMPIGMQLIGKPFGEHTMLRAAYSFEQTREYKRPELSRAVKRTAVYD